jgi:EmrB/QacA subfamily drug resistance transporter
MTARQARVSPGTTTKATRQTTTTSITEGVTMSSTAPAPPPTPADTQEHHDHHQHSQDETGPKKSWALLGVALAAQILVVLDISVVNTALPSIGRSLGLGGSQLAWIVTAYLMMSGGGLLLGGRIADLLSRRTVFLTGLTLFTAASLLSGFAETGGQLIATRSVQGLSAALLTPSALALIMTTYAGAQRKTALATWGAVGSLGVAAGVLLGGAITTWTSWQFIFWVNGPVGLIALLVGTRIIAKQKAPRPTLGAFDLPGAAAVIGGLASLIYALGGTAAHGWWSIHTATAFAASFALLVTFLELEQRAARPLFPPHIWKLDSLVSGTAVMLGVTGILVGTVFLTSILLQTVLGFTALRTGLAFVPFALAITAGTVVARHLLAHVSPRAIATAGLLITTGAALLLSHAGDDAHYASDILPWLFALGLGIGMVFVPVSVTSMAGIPASHAGVASGFLMTGHEIGAALGVAVLSAIASTAGSLTTASGAADAFSRGFLGAAAMGAVVAVFALLRMSRTVAAGNGGHMHMH